MYEKFYRSGQNLIRSIFYTNKDFKKNIATLIQKGNFTNIYDIGGSDGVLLNYLNLKNKKYFCYDIDKYNLLKSKRKFNNIKNIKFINKSLEKVKIKNNCKSLILLIGVLHHVDDNLIKKFLAQNSTKLNIIALDGFYHKKQNLISKLLLKLDKGNYVRDFKHYKKILNGFRFKKRINYYLRFYSHLISYKNIDKELIKIL